MGTSMVSVKTKTQSAERTVRFGLLVCFLGAMFLSSRANAASYADLYPAAEAVFGDVDAKDETAAIGEAAMTSAAAAAEETKAPSDEASKEEEKYPLLGV